MKDAWTQITPSQHAHEREALAFLKDALPDHEPWRAWANFEFVADGNVSEVDVLVISPYGVFLVEAKGWPGRLEGDAGTWRWFPPDGRRPRDYDNPLVLANRKAQRLKSLLGRQRAARGVRLPYIMPLVFLSEPDLQVALSDGARDRVVLATARSGLPGIHEYLSRPRNPERPERVVDRPAARVLAMALDQAGVRESTGRRKVGDLVLDELIDEGPGFQDHVARHPQFPRVQHRVRIYGVGDAASTEERERLARAGRREYELLAAADHPGIISPQSFVEHELGPALVFPRDPEERRLDHVLREQAGALNLFERIALIRDIAEALAHAHSRRLFHRALSPRSVLVSRGRPQVFNWQAGANEDADTAATVAGTRHLEELVDAPDSGYLAPEGLTVPDADPALLDVFSLGAIAFHVFCGEPPAATAAELASVLQRDGALEVSARLDGASGLLADLVREATRADATRRTPTVPQFLADLGEVEDELTRDADPESVITPEEARNGDWIGPFVFDRRLGRGSTAIALLVEDEDERRFVLKVANDPDRNDRVRDEGAVLAKLRHPAIVAVHGDPIELSGRLAITLDYAALGTVARRLRDDGRLSLENLQDWGDDLLAALAYLEQEGIPHRDIKPDNLGVAEVGASKKPRLVLLDFSLSRAPLDQLEVGTRPYVDPFLGEPDRRRWDLAADRFAAAVTLHEMATGALPFWGAREVKADPRMVADEATIEADLLPREVTGPLADFLARALRRDANARFDTAEEMLRAWRALFADLDAVEAGDELDPALLAAATLASSVAAIGLGARATDALDRLGVVTVADLLDTAPIEFNRLRGVGLATRRRLVEARRALRARLGAAATNTTQDEAPDVQALDALAAQLVPKLTARNTSQAQGLRRLLGLEPIAATGPWPSQTEVAASMEVTRARVGQIVGQGRERWRRLPAVTRLRDELISYLNAFGGVASVRELERVVAGQRGGGDPHGSFARAAVRAAVEAESTREAPRLTPRRAGDRLLLASAREDGADRQPVLDFAVHLGARADQLVADGALLSPGEAQAELRRLTTPPGLGELTDERLVTLAAEASGTAAVSGRLELHARDLDPVRALRLGRPALLGADALEPAEVRRRIAARFPAAPALPERPALDALLEQAEADLRWDAATERYVPRRPALQELTDISSSLTRFATATSTWLPVPTDPEVARAQEFDERLRGVAGGGRLVVLTVPPRRLAAAERQLRTLEVSDLDLDRLVVDALRASATAARARWERVVAADAAQPGSVDAQRLGALVARAFDAVEATITEQPGTVLLRHPGLLARYGQLALLDRLRERLLVGGPPSAVWLLVGADQQTERPLIDGHAVPILSNNELLRIPDAWLQNRHRAGASERNAA